MTDRKIFDLFYGARADDLDMCRRAYETGADINFAFDGRRATKGGAGRWYVTCFLANVVTSELRRLKVKRMHPGVKPRHVRWRLVPPQGDMACVLRHLFALFHL